MYDDLDMLGAEDSAPPVAKVSASLVPSFAGEPGVLRVSVNGSPERRIKDPALVKRVDRLSGTYALCVLAGTVLGAVGGALGWESHRVAGGLLGGLLVGPVVGSLTGQGLVHSEARDLNRDLTAAWSKGEPA